MLRYVRSLRAGVIAVVLLGAMLTGPIGAEKPRVPPPPKAAQAYEMVDAHAREKVTIAAEPGDTKAARPDTRLDYYGHGMMPIRVIVTNDSESTVTLDDARIHLIAADNTVIQAATLDDLQRRLFTVKSATGTKLPLGLPIPITVGKKNIDKKITQDDQDFSFQTTEIKPHTTVAGWLFYDMEGSPSPFLEHATLELKRVRLAGTGQVLDTFEVPLHPAREATQP